MRLVISDDECGRALKNYVSERTMRLRTYSAAAVLQLPEVGRTYLKGRSRQAVRTNIKRADELGLVCKAVSGEMFCDAARAALQAGSTIKYLDSLLAEPIGQGMEHWIGYDAAGEAIAFVRLRAMANVAWIGCLTTLHDDPRSIIRYKLSAEIFMDLADRKISKVIAGSAVGLPDGLLFFQHLLGFRAVRLDVVPAGKAAAGMRRVATRKDKDVVEAT